MNAVWGTLLGALVNVLFTVFRRHRMSSSFS